jgi:hypothetical protein
MDTENWQDKVAISSVMFISMTVGHILSDHEMSEGYMHIETWGRYV